MMAAQTVAGGLPKLARGSLDPIFCIPKKNKYEVTTLPEEILHMIFILVVLQDGDPAIHTPALTCTRFWRIMRGEYFLKEARFCWLDSVVNWKAFSEEHRRTYRIPYQISCCIQCKSLYKDCEGYRGCGQRGKLQGFYSDNESAGYCSADGGWRHFVITDFLLDM
ncbi:hypothetical protein ROHU_008909 [Labeo rohita]|uniref:CxC7-like cysteine cluster associated with KDZ transposases domain-containing protein n=1 Tax=Labeo rohita TaxID=84645 RepID=A0A498M5L6_LABRO|nr:hypothetical protein ROHU_008909 [Labeo rohita]